MKVAILTFAVTNNYGATLQCYAMSEFLKSHGHETIILNVPLQKAGAARNKQTLLDRVLSRIKLLKTSLYGQTEGRYYRTAEEIAKDREYEAKNMKLFDEFRDKYFKELSHPYIVEQDFIDDYPDADAYIVGSDQVWNPWVTNFQYPLFFFSFVKPGRIKISYAACMGGDSNFEFTSEEERTIKELLDKFNAIGVRDKTAMSILANKFNMNSTEVLDPTFLVDINVYDHILRDSDINASGSLFNFKFIINDSWVNVIKSISNDLHLSIRMDSCLIPIKGLPFHPLCSVQDWLKLIKTSDFVFTDSFHGMVFCILFKKQFIATPSYKGGEERYMDLASKFGLEDRVFMNAKEVMKAQAWKKKIDYSKVYEKLGPLKKDSQLFLLNQLCKK